MDAAGQQRPTRVTLQDVAEEARVSTATVSRYYNNREALRPDTIREVQRAIETLDTIQISTRARWPVGGLQRSAQSFQRLKTQSLPRV